MRWSTDVVQVDRAKRAAFELDHDLRNIFDVDFQGAASLDERREPPRSAEDPAQRVQLVAGSKNRAAAEVTPRSVAPTVVLPRVPVGQIFADVGLGADDTTNHVGVDK